MKMVSALARMAPKEARKIVNKLVKAGLIGRKEAAKLLKAALKEARAAQRRIAVFVAQEARREYAKAKPAAVRLARRGAGAGLRIASRAARKALGAGRTYSKSH